MAANERKEHGQRMPGECLEMHGMPIGSPLPLMPESLALPQTFVFFCGYFLALRISEAIFIDLSHRFLTLFCTSALPKQARYSPIGARAYHGTNTGIITGRFFGESGEGIARSGEVADPWIR